MIRVAAIGEDGLVVQITDEPPNPKWPTPPSVSILRSDGAQFGGRYMVIEVGMLGALARACRTYLDKNRRRAKGGEWVDDKTFVQEEAT